LQDGLVQSQHALVHNKHELNPAVNQQTYMLQLNSLAAIIHKYIKLLFKPISKQGANEQIWRTNSNLWHQNCSLRKALLENRFH